MRQGRQISAGADRAFGGDDRMHAVVEQATSSSISW
jgi:hypothetical protein